MNKFELGQKVLCIQGNDENPVHHLLQKNEIYTIFRIDAIGKLLEIREIPNEPFHATRFISLTEARRRKIKTLYEDNNV